MKKFIILSILSIYFVAPMLGQIESRGFPVTDQKHVFKGFPEKDPSDVNGVNGVPIVENIFLLVALGLGYAAIRGIKAYKHRKKYY